MMRRLVSYLLSLIVALPCAAAPLRPSEILPAQNLLAMRVSEAPTSNRAFVPGQDAVAAPPWSAVLRIAQSQLRAKPTLEHPLQGARDARLFPAVTLEFVTLGDVLVPLQRGEMVTETPGQAKPSYWQVIPQFGKVWHEAADGGWSRAAFPLMLVNDTENHAQQGLATFLYRDKEVSALTMQFVQQSAPYLLHQHAVLWGQAPMTAQQSDAARMAAARALARAELAARLPVARWSELEKRVPKGALRDFGAPLYAKWRVAGAIVRDGRLYYQDSETDYGAYPYTLEMRFGVRSIMKSVAAPLALLRLAEIYGPWVLQLKIGDYVEALDPKWRRIRFLDAVDMASGFGGTGSLGTQPNDPFSGYLEGDYDAWYTAPSLAQKLRVINQNWRPYPWEPGTVMRYRDQDFFLLGVAIDRFLKSMHADAELWPWLEHEVLQPIGIAHAPAVHTREPDGGAGLVWCNAGYYPTLDDLAKIALLYQNLGAWHGRQILNRQLTAELLAAQGALLKTGDASLGVARDAGGSDALRYKMGWHFNPYIGSKSHKRYWLPTMQGSGENEVVLYPNGIITIRMAKAAELPTGESASSSDVDAGHRIIDRLAPF